MPVTQNLALSEEPYKTNETYTVSNQDFLTALFGEEAGELRPVLVSFAGDPRRVKKAEWTGQVWNLDSAPPAPDRNNYFSLASFRPDETGQYRRRKVQFHALHAVMLDDIGTKIEIERLALPPSWMLETSPRNYQAGYILETPIQDSLTADRLMNAIIQAGLCDPGASGPTARLARLPEGVNGKHAPAFPCTLKSWKPALRYSIVDLVNGLSLDLRETGRPKKTLETEIKERPDAGEEIFIPCPDENAILTALKARRLYKNPLGNGKHEITCPWVSEHTGAIDGGTAYFEPDDNYPIGGFKCLHGHCAERHVRDLLQYLSVEVKDARMKPVIRCIAGEIHRISDRAQQELVTPGLYYQRGGLIVTIATDPGTKETCVKNLSLPALTVLRLFFAV